MKNEPTGARLPDVRLHQTNQGGELIEPNSHWATLRNERQITFSDVQNLLRNLCFLHCKATVISGKLKYD